MLLRNVLLLSGSLVVFAACSGTPAADASPTSAPAALAQTGDGVPSAPVAARAPENHLPRVHGARTALSASAPGSDSAPPDPSTTGDGRTTKTLECTLEYEVFEPTFVSGFAASVSAALSDVKKNGAFAADDAYDLELAMNPNPPYNLSFQASIFDTHSGKEVSYLVLPPVGGDGAYLFEVGGAIPTTERTGYDGATHAFDHVRAYCSLH